MNQETQTATFNGENLYREESFTDRTVGTLRRMTPVDKEGNIDNSRAVVYVGQTQVMTAMGALPLSFELQADNLADAIAGFSDGAKVAFEDAMKELEELRREQASSIVMPGAGGDLPGGGKIQL